MALYGCGGSEVIAAGQDSCRSLVCVIEGTVLLFLGLGATDGLTPSQPQKRFALKSGYLIIRVLDTLDDLVSTNSPGADSMARILPSAQKEIALIAGLARMTVPRMLSKLRTLGTLIDVNGGGL